MFSRHLINFQKLQIRSVQSAGRKKMNEKFRKKRIVMGQNEENFPLYEFSRSERTDRRIYAWGFAATGALGVHQSLKKQASKQSHIVNYPTRQSFAERRQVIDCAAGYGFTLFACKREDDNISLFGCGLNTDSQISYHKLGGITNKPMELLVYPAPIFLPKSNENEEIHIIKCAAGRAHSAALSNDGHIFSFGNNAFGQCGRKVIEGEIYAVNQLIHRIDGNKLSPGAKVVDIVCGLDHMLVLFDDGKVFSCGWGADGQTGLGHYDSVDKLTQIKGDILNEKIVKIASRVDCVLAINDKGEVFGWGNSEYGQLGTKDDMQQLHTPIYLKPTKKCGKVIDVAAGGSFCLALNENGDVFTWGYGILGFGPNVDFVKEPTLVSPVLFGKNEFNRDTRVTSITCGVNHSGAITSTNDVFMWGKNKFGCLGFGNEKDQFFPLKVNLGAKCLKLVCGIDHSLAFCSPHI